MSEAQVLQQPQINGNILTGADEYVAQFVFWEIGAPAPEPPYQAIGIIWEGELVGGVVYTSPVLDQAGKMISCEVSIALTEPRAFTRRVIKAVFRYPFEILGCKYIWGGVKRKAKAVRRFDERLGFKCKCIIEDADPAGGDMALYYMNRKHCRWL